MERASSGHGQTRSPLSSPTALEEDTSDASFPIFPHAESSTPISSHTSATLLSAPSSSNAPSFSSGGVSSLCTTATIDVYSIYATPLVDRKVGESLAVLDVDEDIFIMRKTLTETERKVTFCSEPATVENLRQRVTQGARVVHFNGHGSQDSSIYFEDQSGNGKADKISPRKLVETLSAGQGIEMVKVAVVSACYSEEMGRALVEAGVHHVVAVKLSKQLVDQNCPKFMRQFYIQLLAGQTVQSAFDAAKGTLNGVNKCPGQSGDEVFLLLPEQADHNVVVFPKDAAPFEGSWIDKSPKPKRWESVPLSSPPALACRNSSMQQVLEHIIGSGPSSSRNTRLVTLLAEYGAGKTTLAKSVVRYMIERPQNGFKAYYWVEDFKQLTPSLSLAELIGQKISPTSEIKNKVDLQNFLNAEEQQVLLVLDGVEMLRQECLSHRNEACCHDVKSISYDHCPTQLLDHLFSFCPRLTVLVTMESSQFKRFREFGWCDRTPVKEAVVELEPLSHEEAGRLFWRHLPVNKKKAFAQELNEACRHESENVKSAVVKLGQDLHMLGGNPLRIVNTANLFQTELTSRQDLCKKLASGGTSSRRSSGDIGTEEVERITRAEAERRLLLLAPGNFILRHGSDRMVCSHKGWNKKVIHTLVPSERNGGQTIYYCHDFSRNKLMPCHSISSLRLRLRAFASSRNHVLPYTCMGVSQGIKDPHQGKQLEEKRVGSGDESIPALNREDAIEMLQAEPRDTCYVFISKPRGICYVLRRSPNYEGIVCTFLRSNTPVHAKVPVRPIENGDGAVEYRRFPEFRHFPPIIRSLEHLKQLIEDYFLNER
eukprot:gb/GEZN01001338.1/.p1 GENE.gb/GEZN01001338.1/~~gb/GEZN01001338.1/.p1  ORF type:complete len:826 (-),score=94.50 gb/GEZN01001338.1/:601-3078(-)